MIILLSGTTHTGKTLLAQKLLEKYKFPYLSIDHLKMGLIRSGNTSLTAGDDEKLTPYLWAIVKEMVNTAIENDQNLIVEGCYIPFDWKNDFDERYLAEIKFYCLIMTADYIESNFSDICNHENAIEKRLVREDITKEQLIKDNERNLERCKKYGLEYILINKEYTLDSRLPQGFITDAI